MGWWGIAKRIEYIYIYICIYARIYAHMCEYARICAHICIYARIYAYMHAYMHICHIYAYMRADIKICAHVCIYARICAYMRADTQTCAHICVYARICAYMSRQLGTSPPPMRVRPPPLLWEWVWVGSECMFSNCFIATAPYVKESSPSLLSKPPPLGEREQEHT